MQHQSPLLPSSSYGKYGKNRYVIKHVPVGDGPFTKYVTLVDYSPGRIIAPCKCGSLLYNISGIPENQCYDCYKGPKCKCGIFYIFCISCVKNSK
jgi:hypothetical protein